MLLDYHGGAQPFPAQIGHRADGWRPVEADPRPRRAPRRHLRQRQGFLRDPVQYRVPRRRSCLWDGDSRPSRGPADPPRQGRSQRARRLVADAGKRVDLVVGDLGDRARAAGPLDPADRLPGRSRHHRDSGDGVSGVWTGLAVAGASRRARLARLSLPDQPAVVCRHPPRPRAAAPELRALPAALGDRRYGPLRGTAKARRRATRNIGAVHRRRRFHNLFRVGRAGNPGRHHQRISRRRVRRRFSATAGW